MDYAEDCALAVGAEAGARKANRGEGRDEGIETKIKMKIQTKTGVQTKVKTRGGTKAFLDRVATGCNLDHIGVAWPGKDAWATARSYGAWRGCMDDGGGSAVGNI